MNARLLLLLALLAGALLPAPAHATFPGANGRIAFESQAEIYSIEPDGSGEARLTTNLAAESQPSWSPDGQQIAFVSDRDGNFEVYVMNANGSGQTRLTVNLAFDYAPAWSADGTRIGFHSDRDGSGDVYVMDADGTDITRVTSGGLSACCAGPSFSPAGRITYQSSRSGNTDVYSVNADGTGEVRLTDAPQIDGDPDYSPDGERIVYQSYIGGDAQVFVMNADGTDETQVTNGAGHHYAAAWSPDSTKIAFTRFCCTAEQVYVVNADGSDEAPLGGGSPPNIGPNWQPIPGLRFTGTDPASPANDNSPKVKGVAEAGSTVTLYATSDCSGPEAATGPAADFASPGLEVAVADDTTTTFRVTATDQANNTTSCSASSISYTEDSTPPATPTVSATAPASPANDNSPKVSGVAEAGSTVNVYATSDCSGPEAATGPAADFATPGLAGSVPDDTTATFRATATDQAGNSSTCSASSISYTEDSTPPTVSLTDTDPASPANDNSPHVKGVAEAGSTVKLYPTSDCSGPEAATGPAADFTTPGLAVSVADDTATTFRATATDQAGNSSACSSGSLTYVEDTAPPSAGLALSPQPVLTGEAVSFDASASSDQPGGTIIRYEWDLDDDGFFETDTGVSPTTSRSFSAPAAITTRVRVTSSLGLSGTAVAPLTIRRRPPPGRVGVSINAGSQFTNDPNVTLSPVWPAYTVDLVVSNDGGFADAETFDVNALIPWSLDSSGPERLPKTVYARFDGGIQTFTDDIILDETAPNVSSAELTGGGVAATTAIRDARTRRFTLRVRARDNLSGVATMQLARRKRQPGGVRRFRRRLTIRAARPPNYVRVRDRAGNFSRWRRIHSG